MCSAPGSEPGFGPVICVPIPLSIFITDKFPQPPANNFGC
jgi:hypothetical protein